MIERMLTVEHCDGFEIDNNPFNPEKRNESGFLAIKMIPRRFKTKFGYMLS